MSSSLAVKTPSQWELVLERLESGKSITQFEAFTELGIGHLARRILTLREKGYEITAEWIEVRKGNGQTARVKKYALKEKVEAI